MISLGCAKNLVDSEVMLGHLPKDRYAIVTDEAQADIILINTCAFVEEAKEESVDAILDAAEYKAKGSCRLLA
ncbi:MAG: 30S ribosomal protein S12 methylthiotransferase RimO, partial [Deltaproteobacteria bacterium]|nr:30S ribosomal protein S12 methylthiotransferase RimO [Deltaproteobacteria bacterium]